MPIVLEPFPFAGDGFTVEHLKVGDKRDFGAATGGLIAAGLVSADNASQAIEAPHADLDANIEEQANAVTEETATEDTAAPRRGRQRRG